MNNKATLLTAIGVALVPSSRVLAHGTVVDPVSRVYRVYQSNPENPNFPLAQAAVAIDGKTSYYTWNELSRNIPEAVQAGLPPGFDYSPWVPDGQLASGGRVDPSSNEYPRTYAGLDQVSADWPTTTVTAGDTIQIDFLATAAHDPSVWDVWMTTADWDAGTAMNWGEMEFLGRPQPVLVSGHYRFDLTLPSDRTGHHVLWIAWQRDDPAGEVFFSTSDLLMEASDGLGTTYCDPAEDNSSGGPAVMGAVGSPFALDNDLTLIAAGMPQNQFGYFLASETQGFVANPGGSQGNLCLGGAIARFSNQVQSTGGSGSFSLSVDLTAMPPPAQTVVAAGETWSFQAWFRDANPTPTSNFTDGVAVGFL